MEELEGLFGALGAKPMAPRKPAGPPPLDPKLLERVLGAVQALLGAGPLDGAGFQRLLAAAGAASATETLEKFQQVLTKSNVTYKYMCVNACEGWG